jgi:hypothetical protein
MKEYLIILKQYTMKQFWPVTTLFILITVVSGLGFSVYNLAHPKQEQRISVSLTLQEADLVLKALGKLPLEESGNLFFNIQRQAISQAQQKQKIDSNAINSSRGQKKN